VIVPLVLTIIPEFCIASKKAEVVNSFTTKPLILELGFPLLTKARSWMFALEFPPAASTYKIPDAEEGMVKVNCPLEFALPVDRGEALPTDSKTTEAPDMGESPPITVPLTATELLEEETPVLPPPPHPDNKKALKIKNKNKE
jgi:hypothetical protein